MQAWTQRRLGYVGFALAGLLLVVVGAVSYRQMLRLEEARELATHTLLLREEIEVLFSLIKDAGKVVDTALERGLLINAPRPDSLRFMPSLTVTRAEIDRMVAVLEGCLA